MILQEGYNILVISHNSFSNHSNNGKTMESLLAKFEKKQIAQIYFSNNEVPDFDFCDRYYQITDVDVFKSVFRLFNSCGRKVSALQDNPGNSGKKMRFSIYRLMSLVKATFPKATLLRDFLWSICKWKSDDLLQWCIKHEPKIIFFVGGDSKFSHKIAIDLSKYLGVPLVSFFTDDYVIYSASLLGEYSISHRLLLRQFKETISQSSQLYCIGKEMADEYSRLFNSTFMYVMNSVKVRDFDDGYFLLPDKEQFVVGYFGGLHLDRWKMIVRFSKISSKIKINVYCMENPSKHICEEFRKNGVIFKGGVVGNELKLAMSKCDMLLHIESDNVKYTSLTRLSVSTKIPEYLMSSRLVLAYGPEFLASMKLLSDNQIGCVFSSSIEDQDVSIMLEHILSDREKREAIVRKAYNFGLKEFSQERNSTSFRRNLISLIE